MNKTPDEKIIIELAKNYHIVSKVAVKVLNANGDEIFREPMFSDGCDFCKNFNEFETYAPSLACKSNHNLSSKRAFKSNDNYVYTCPSNFVFWSSSVLKNNKLLATIVAGNTLFDNKETIINSYKKIAKTEKQRKTLHKLEEFDYITKQEFKALVSILKLSTSSLFDKSTCQCNGNCGGDKCSCGFIKDVRSKEIQNDDDNELKLIGYIDANDENNAIAILDKIYLSIINATKINFLTVRSNALHFVLFLNYILHEKNNTSNEAFFETNLAYINELYLQENIESLNIWLKRNIKQFSKDMFKINNSKHGDSLAKAIFYGKNNLSLDLTLESVAEKAGLSSSYFSRIFKQEMKISFTEYLNNIRITESKRLLRETDLKLSDIALKCGFTDQSYFTKTFKKFVNLSPGKYRSNYNNYKNNH